MVRVDKIVSEASDGKRNSMKVLNGHAVYLPLQIVYCNIGNPQSLGQPPITFFREVNCFLQSIFCSSACSELLNLKSHAPCFNLNNIPL